MSQLDQLPKLKLHIPQTPTQVKYSISEPYLSYYTSVQRMLRERHPLSNKKEKDKIHPTITVMGWSQHSNSQLYQQVRLVSHGAVEVSRPSKVEQAKSKLTVGYNVDVNSSVLHRKRRVQKMREREIRREDKKTCQLIHPVNLHFSLV